MITQEALNEIMKLLPPPQDVEADTYCLPITLFKDSARTMLLSEIDFHFKKEEGNKWPGWILTNVVPYKVT